MLYYRQKIILALLETFDGALKSTEFQKYLFLFSQWQVKEPKYHFVPYKFGCFSFQSSKDKQYLVDNGYLEDKKEWVLITNQKKYIYELTENDNKTMIRLKNKVKNLTTNELIRYVYLEYPYYTLRSEIKDKILTAEEKNKINNVITLNNINFKADSMLFSIGYEGLSIEKYVNKLIVNDVKVLCDVRKNPLSRKHGFSKNALADMMGKFDIKYVHIPELGIESSNRKDLNSLDDYICLFEEYKNKVLANQTSSLNRIYDILKNEKRIALTCFEADPRYCHRTKIAECMQGLPEWEYEVKEL